MVTMFSESSLEIIKVATLGISSFILAMALTPMLSNIMYKYKLWRKVARSTALGGGKATYVERFHKKNELSTPRFGGVLIWTVPPLIALLFFVLSQSGIWWTEQLNFLTRSQVWLPLATLVMASLVGFIDDIIQVLKKPTKGFIYTLWNFIEDTRSGGMRLRYRLLMVSTIGFVGALWFFYKLGWNTIHIPGDGDLMIGIWYIPFFVIVMIATYSGGVIDGLDGLAGGTFASIFAAFALIAFSGGQTDLAAFCLVIVGTILAFLWFNIPPARFYMGESGMMGLTATLTVVAFLTDSVLVLPIIGSLLVVESGSDIIQLTSKKLFHKKVFLSTPIHHHFEAKGWPQHKITMRFWVIGIVTAIIGVAIRLLG